MPVTSEFIEEKRVLRFEVSGNPTVDEIENVGYEMDRLLGKFNPKELKLLSVACDGKVMSPEAVKIMQQQQSKFTNFAKVATVISGILFEAQLKKSGKEAGDMDNRRLFKSEEEAMKWLME